MQKVPGSKSPSIRWAENFLCSSVHPAANGYPTLFRAGDGLDGEGKGDVHHPSHAMPIYTCGTLSIHCPYFQSTMGLTFTFFWSPEIIITPCYNFFTIRPLIYTSQIASIYGCFAAFYHNFAIPLHLLSLLSPLHLCPGAVEVGGRRMAPPLFWPPCSSK